MKGNDIKLKRVTDSLEDRVRITDCRLEDSGKEKEFTVLAISFLADLEF